MTTTIDGQLEEAKRQRLQEIEQELEVAGDELGAATVEHERTRDDRDQALRRYRRALQTHRHLLQGKDVQA